MQTLAPQINYVEFGTPDLSATKRFFEAAFGWAFTDYGPDYAAFAGQGLDGGFFTAPAVSRQAQGGALIVFHSAQLGDTLARVQAAGGEVLKPIFAFPGGRRFHFSEPGGNELAVWGNPL
jgi:predicted enzyme related to lactoylglutathione lyase